ncbi:MAG TPA: hypothetical protein P5513_08570 [Candidatus Diapherotrites archaeon]|nr:hypothetical protein [Candidatus Diapherotrites archaeon]
MKNNKTIRIILVLIILSVIFYNTTCNKQEIIKKDITVFCSNVLKYDGTFGEYGAPNNIYALDSFENVKFYKLFLDCKSKQQYQPEDLFDEVCPSGHILTCSFSDLFFKKIYATVGPLIIPNGNIENISVFSNNDYDSIHKTGDILSDIILISYLDEWIYSSSIALNNFLKDKPECKFSLNFYFTTPPFEADTHILTLQYRETDGTSYEMIFKPVIVEP